MSTRFVSGDGQAFSKLSGQDNSVKLFSGLQGRFVMIGENKSKAEGADE